MSRYIQIHMNAATPDLHALARDVGEVLGVEFRPVDESGDLWAALALHTVFRLVENTDAENDRDMDFKHFRWYLELDPRFPTNDHEAWERRYFEEGWRIYEMLRASGRFELMLTDDGQKKLAEHRVPIPTPPPTHTK